MTSPRLRLSPYLAPCAVALATLVGCSDSTVGPSGPLPPRGIVVLNAYGQQGVTLLPDSGSGSSRIDFGGLFDGGGFSLERDTLVATSSKAGGDLLYVANVATGSLLKVQLPAGSNPGGTSFGSASLGGRVLVALRDSGAIAMVTPRTAGSVVTLLRGAGRCPYDAFVQGGAVWSVDANLNCGVGYTPLGASRLIRIVPGDARRDTLPLGADVVNASGAVLSGDVAYVGAQGQVDYSAQPYRLVSVGSVVRVDLRARRVTHRFAMPPGSTSAGVRLGADGRLYVAYYADLATFARRVIALDAQSLTPVGPRAPGVPHLDLRRADGTAVACGATTADARGRIHCVVNGAASAATLHVFDAAGRELRTAPAGQGAVDLALR
jgi:hypothetical protein